MILPAARIVTPTGTQGSGVVIARTENGTYVLTNHHIVKECIQQEDRWDPVEKSSKKVERCLPVSVEIFRYDDRGRHLQTVTTAAEIAAYTPFGDKWNFEGDLALLRLRAPVEGVPAAQIIGEGEFMEEVRMLDEVVMVGCPDGSEMPLPTTGHVASLTEERAGVGLLLSQVFGNPGSSGSAVYRYSLERGAYEVVAVHSMVDSRGSLTDVGRGSFLRLAIPAPTLHSFLNAHGFSHLVTRGQAQGEDESEGKGEDAKTEVQDGGDGKDEQQEPTVAAGAADDAAPAGNASAVGAADDAAAPGNASATGAADDAAAPGNASATGGVPADPAAGG